LALSPDVVRVGRACPIKRTRLPGGRQERVLTIKGNAIDELEISRTAWMASAQIRYFKPSEHAHD
jgi:hypothetical protein